MNQYQIRKLTGTCSEYMRVWRSGTEVATAHNEIDYCPYELRYELRRSICEVTKSFYPFLFTTFYSVTTYLSICSN